MSDPIANWQTRQFEFFDLLASLNKGLSSLPLDASTTALYETIQDHLLQLFPFESSVFITPNPTTFEFELNHCFPETTRPLAQQALDQIIDEGTFAWSLQQNRPVVLRSVKLQKSLLLHSLATPGHKFGMYLGITRIGKISEIDTMLPMLGVILQRAAYVLERDNLYRQISDQNLELEKKVKLRTVELQDALATAQARETQFRVIFDASPDVIWMVHPENFQILTANPTTHALLGYPPESLVQRSLASLVAPSDRDSVSRQLSTATESPVSLFSRHFIHTSGDEIEFDLSIKRVPWQSGNAILVTLRDTALRRQIESERLKVGKLESMGLLAGGIAHNFNNILQSIQGNIALAKLDTPESQPVFQFLENSENACDRARQIANQLLTFSKGGAPIRKKITLRAFLDETLQGFPLPKSVLFEIVDSNEPLWAEIDANQMRHALHQILLNAAESSALTGKIEIHLHQWVIPPGEISSMDPGHYATLTIRDHGCGIPEENLGKIFDPYFSTKQGHSGLGLATAFSIVRNHGGHLTLQSRVNMGSVFHLALPACDAPQPILPESATPPSAIPSEGPIRILHMDDEDSLRLMMSALLKRLGYQVDCVKDGKEALGAYESARSSTNPYHLVILDLTIPGGMGGQETIEKLRAMDPHVKAIVCSGYSNDPIMGNHRQYGFSGILPKPFKFQELTDTLKNLIPASANSGTKSSPKRPA